MEDYETADHKVILEHKGFLLIGVELLDRWSVTITARAPHLLAFVPKNTIDAESKDKAFVLARDAADSLLRSWMRPA